MSAVEKTSEPIGLPRPVAAPRQPHAKEPRRTAVRVELASALSVGVDVAARRQPKSATPNDAHLAEVGAAGELDVLVGRDEVRALDRAGRHQTRAVAGLVAVGDHGLLGIADGRAGLDGAPEALPASARGSARIDGRSRRRC